MTFPRNFQPLGDNYEHATLATQCNNEASGDVMEVVQSHETCTYSQMKFIRRLLKWMWLKVANIMKQWKAVDIAKPSGAT